MKDAEIAAKCAETIRNYWAKRGVKGITVSVEKDNSIRSNIDKLTYSAATRSFSL